MQDVLGWALEDQPRRVVQVGVVGGFDGARTLAQWREQSEQTVARLGAELGAVDVRTRDDATSPALAEAVAGAGLVLLVGETSGYVVQTLRASAVWEAVLAAWRDGAAIAASGVAAMALCGSVPEARPSRSGPSRGLGVVPALRLVPDIDGLGPAIPHSVLARLADPRATVVGLDRATALAGEPAADPGPWEFRARGRGSAWVIEAEARRRVLAPLLLDVAGEVP